MHSDFEAKFNKERSDFNNSFKIMSVVIVGVPVLLLVVFIVALLSGTFKAQPGEKNVGDVFNTVGVSLGLHGVSEIRCMGGYKFIVAKNGTSRQVLNENGGGVKCP